MACAMDWPLSQEEKKGHLLRLYDKDAQATETMLKSGEAALAALRSELSKLRQYADESHISAGKNVPCQAQRHDSPARSLRKPQRNAEQLEQAERMRLAGLAVAEGAAAILRAMLETPSSPQCRGDDDGDDVDDVEVLSISAAPARARSEGAMASRQPDLSSPLKPLRPALSRTPRRSRCGTPRKRVSFSDRPDNLDDSDMEIECATFRVPDRMPARNASHEEPEPEIQDACCRANVERTPRLKNAISVPRSAQIKDACSDSASDSGDDWSACSVGSDGTMA